MYTFALVPKQLSSPFFDTASQGCLDRARKRHVECLYTGTLFPDAEGQAAVLRNLTNAGNVDGIAVSVVNQTSPAILDAIEYAIDRGIPVITFDSDAPKSKRLSYLGSNNHAMGDLMGKACTHIYR
jgi:ribose transport system substrate-binding protein